MDSSSTNPDPSQAPIPSFSLSLFLHGGLTLLGCAVALFVDAHRDVMVVGLHVLFIVLLSGVGHLIYTSGEYRQGRRLVGALTAALGLVVCVATTLHNGAMMVAWGFLAAHSLYYVVSPVAVRVILCGFAFVFGAQLSPSVFTWLLSPRFW